jgi:hypothetical protein
MDIHQHYHCQRNLKNSDAKKGLNCQMMRGSVPLKDASHPLNHVKASNSEQHKAVPTQQEQQQMATRGTGRLPPIILISNVSFLKIQRDINEIVKNNLKFMTTQNLVQVVTKDMAYYSAITTLIRTISIILSSSEIKRGHQVFYPSSSQ